MSPKKGRKPIPQTYDEDEEEEKTGGGGISQSYKLRRDLLGDGDRLDTVEGDDDGNDYGDEKNDGETEKIQVNLDDVDDDDDNESLLGQRNNSSLLGGSLGQGPSSLF